jgi:folate-binding protein YgfZ
VIIKKLILICICFKEKGEDVMNITHLPHRGVIQIQGEDKAPFLQGLITNDVALITPTHAIYAALLTPQGRFLYDLFIIEKDNSYLLDVEMERLEALLKKLSLYKLRSQVTLKSRHDLKVYALWGEESALPKEAYPDPRLVELGARMMGTLSETATPQDYDMHRLILGVPEGGQDLIPEKAILLESGLDELNAISWTKGCYMGQELTARTKYRGLVRKRLFPVIIEGEPPPFGSEIFLDGTSVGEMRTSNKEHGLALLRLEAREATGNLICETARLKPYAPDWMRLEELS